MIVEMVVLGINSILAILLTLAHELWSLQIHFLWIKVRYFPMTIANRKYCSIVTKLISLKSLKKMLSIYEVFICLTDQVTAKLVFGICDERKMKSDELFLYHTVYITDYNAP